MEKHITELEAIYPLKVRRLVASFTGSKEQAMMGFLDRIALTNPCGGFPFFYNLNSQQAICGATTMDNFKAW